MQSEPQGILRRLPASFSSVSLGLFQMKLFQMKLFQNSKSLDTDAGLPQAIGPTSHLTNPLSVMAYR